MLIQLVCLAQLSTNDYYLQYRYRICFKCSDLFKIIQDLYNSEAVAPKCSEEKLFQRKLQASRHMCFYINFCKKHLFAEHHLTSATVSCLSSISCLSSYRGETFCSLLMARCLLLFAHCSLRFACCSLHFACCLLLFTCCSTRNSKGFFFSKSEQKV